MCIWGEGDPSTYLDGLDDSHEQRPKREGPEAAGDCAKVGLRSVNRVWGNVSTEKQKRASDAFSTFYETGFVFQ